MAANPIRFILGVACVFAAAVPPYFSYLKLEGTASHDPQLFLMMMVAALAIFSVFGVLRLVISSLAQQIVIEIVGSYLLLIALVLAVSAILGQWSETIMWFPILLLFGIPVMFPLIVLSFVGSLMIFRSRIPESTL